MRSPMRRAKKEVKLQPAEAAALAVELRDDKTRTLTSLLLAPRWAHFSFPFGRF